MTLQFVTRGRRVLASASPLRLERATDASVGSPPHGDDRARLGVRVPRQWISSCGGAA